MGQGCGLGLERAVDDPHDAREGKEMGTDWARPNRELRDEFQGMDRGLDKINLQCFVGLHLGGLEN